MKKETIKLSKYTAAYTTIGKGTPVIFLHGFFGDGSKLEPIVREFSENYCCIALDMLGFGDSSKPSIKYLIDHQVELLQEFIEAKKLQDFYLIGYSYGAWAAAAYAIAEAKRIEVNNNTQKNPDLKGLVLVAPAGIRDDSFVGRYNHLKPLLWNTKLVDLALAVIYPFAILLNKRKNLNTIRQFRTEILRQPAAKSFLCDRLRPEDAIDTVEKDIHNITVPTLVIAGEEDKQIPLWHSQTYADKIPQADLKIIPGADHDLLHTHKTEVANSIKKYWQNMQILETGLHVS